MMRDFAYAQATSLEDAIAQQASGAFLVAGGTEALNWMRLGVSSPERVLDISQLEELRGITRTGNRIRIGALVSLSELEKDAVIRESAPALSQACLKAASAQLRNRATIGGNVLQRTRCPYFRVEAPSANKLPWPCNKRDPGSGCSAFGGHYSRAAIFGWSGSCACNQPSDPAIALAALAASVEVVGPRGARTISMTEFHLSQEDAIELIGTVEGEAIYGGPLPEVAADAVLVNRLHADEIIIGYSFDVTRATQNSVYLKVRERESYEYAMTSAAVCLDMDGQSVREVQIALGGVAQKPWRLFDSEPQLVGRALDEATLEPILASEFENARPLVDQEFKTTLAKNTALRAILMAGGQA